VPEPGLSRQIAVRHSLCQAWLITAGVLGQGSYSGLVTGIAMSRLPSLFLILPKGKMIAVYFFFRDHEDRSKKPENPGHFSAAVHQSFPVSH
jgi:hypothetical protein